MQPTTLQSSCARSDYDDQDCSIARALELVGERWTLLIIREAFLGTRRFDDFQRMLGIARNVLQARLERLTDAEIMRRVAYQERPVRYEYRLTKKGVDLWPVIVALLKWGDRHAAPNGPPVVLQHKGLWRRGRRPPALRPLRRRSRGLGRDRGQGAGRDREVVVARVARRGPVGND